MGPLRDFVQSAFGTARAVAGIDDQQRINLNDYRPKKMAQGPTVPRRLPQNRLPQVAIGDLRQQPGNVRQNDEVITYDNVPYYAPKKNTPNDMAFSKSKYQALPLYMPEKQFMKKQLMEKMNGL